MAEKRLANDQVPVAGPGTGIDHTREIASITKTDANFSAGSPTVITGMTINLILPIAGKVVVHGAAQYRSNYYNHPTSGVLLIRIDGIDYLVANDTLDIGVIGPSYAIKLDGLYAANMSAGPHTFELVHYSNGYLEISPTTPAVLVVDYPVELVGAGGAGDANLVVLDIETAGGVDAYSVNATSIYAPVPGTLLPFNLPQAKGVMFEGIATARRNAANRTNVQIGIRIDGVDYNGSAPGHHAADFAETTLSVSKVASLGTGPHTAELIFRRIDPTSGDANITTDATKPARLSAVYATGGGGSTTGQATVLVKEEASTTAPFSTISLSFVVMTGSTVTFNLLETKVVELIAQFPCQGIFALASDIAFGLRIDGVDTPVMKWSQDNAGQVEHVEFTNVLSLLAGLHTISIVAKSNSSPYAVTVPASSDHPIKLTAVYSQPVFGVGSLAKLEVENIVSGDTLNSLAVGTYADVPLTTIAFTLLVDQVVYFSGEGYAFRDDAQLGKQNTQLGISIDGVDYHGTAADTATLGEYLSCPVTVTKAVALLSGSHTVKLRFRRHQAGNSASARLIIDADHPVRLTGLYTNPEEIIDLGIGALKKEEVQNATGTATINSTTTYSLVPGTVISFAIPIAQDVYFHGVGTAKQTTDLNTQIGIRIDGIDYDGSTAVHDTFFAITDVEADVSVAKAISLAPGSHTAQLLIRKTPAVLGDAQLLNGTDRPTRLIALYTDPEEVVKSFLDYARDDSSGTFSTASAAPVLIPSPVVTFTQLKVGNVEAHLTCVSAQNGAFRTRANTWLVLDGTTFVKVAYAGLDGITLYGVPSGGVAVFPSVGVGVHTIKAALSTEDPFGANVMRDFINIFTPNVSAPLTITVRHN